MSVYENFNLAKQYLKKRCTLCINQGKGWEATWEEILKRFRIWRPQYPNFPHISQPGVVTHDHERWSRVKVSLVIETEGGEGGWLQSTYALAHLSTHTSP